MLWTGDISQVLLGQFFHLRIYQTIPMVEHEIDVIRAR